MPASSNRRTMASGPPPTRRANSAGPGWCFPPRPARSLVVEKSVGNLPGHLREHGYRIFAELVRDPHVRAGDRQGRGRGRIRYGNGEAPDAEFLFTIVDREAPVAALVELLQD